MKDVWMRRNGRDDVLEKFEGCFFVNFAGYKAHKSVIK